MKRISTIAALMLGATLSFADCAVGTEMSEAAKVQFVWGLKIPLRDGVQLGGAAYLPRDQKAPVPCILTLTPYIGDMYHSFGMYFAAHGMAFFSVDVRGRGNSEGTFRPFIQEAKDGYDVIEWMAKHPACNGKIAMAGGSYTGYDQWAAAKEFPPHLATIIPVAAPYLGFDFPMTRSIFTPYDMQWLTYISGHAAQQNMFGDMGWWMAKYRELAVTGRPFKDFDSMVGNPSPAFQEWIQHPYPDAYWDAMNPTSEQYARLSIPILTITGDYDGSQRGALRHYHEYMKAASAEGRARHYLVIGPWDHGGTRTATSEFGGVKFGSGALVDLNRLNLEWYRWAMDNGPKPEFLKKPVVYYVIGPGKWRYADTLEAITDHTESYFLHSAQNPSDVLTSGSLQKGGSASGDPDHYVYDPRDTNLSAVESSISLIDMIDQRMVYAASGKALVYHTAAFDKDTEISGFFKLTAWIGIDQPDTDFAASIYEIGEDGSSILLASDVLRARYRENPRTPKLINTTKPLRYDFENFNFISRQIKKGSRLRLVFGPLDSIYGERNYNSGGDVARESAKDSRPVTVMLYHDQAHQSVLTIPLGRPYAAGEPTVPDSYFLKAGQRASAE